MSCCATGLCGRDNETYAQAGLVFHRGRFVCYLCYVLPERFPPIVRCNRQDDCRLIQGHRPPCQTDQERKVEANPLRDGDPKLAAERKRGNPAFQKRQRAGPNWIPHNRRA